MFIPPPPPKPDSPQGLKAALALATKLLAEGADAAVVRQRLADFDLNKIEINQVMATATQAAAVPSVKKAAAPVAVKELEKKVLRESGRRNMLVGGVVLGIGLAVTIGTFAMADKGGTGRYVVAWGAIFFGGIQFCRGFLQTLNLE